MTNSLLTYSEFKSPERALSLFFAEGTRSNRCKGSFKTKQNVEKALQDCPASRHCLISSPSAGAFPPRPHCSPASLYPKAELAVVGRGTTLLADAKSEL